MKKSTVTVVNDLKDSLKNCAVDIKYGENSVYVDVFATFKGQIGWFTVKFDKETSTHWDVVECSKPENILGVKNALSQLIGG